jgi:hypothetical protein
MPDPQVGWTVGSGCCRRKQHSIHALAAAYSSWWDAAWLQLARTSCAACALEPRQRCAAQVLRCVNAASSVHKAAGCGAEPQTCLVSWQFAIAV